MNKHRALIGRLVTVVALTCGPLAASWTGIAQGQTVRSQAVVHLTFDEASGEATDSATAGAAQDNGTFVNGAARSPSPFWGQKGRQALVLDANAKQYVQIPHSADVNRPDAVTFSMFFVNLHAPNEAGFRSIIAKRS